MQRIRQDLLNQLDSIVKELDETAHELQTQQGIGAQRCREKLEEIKLHYQQIQEKVILLM